MEILRETRCIRMQVNFYVVSSFPEWNSTLDRIRDRKEWAILRDMDQAGPFSGIMGNRFEAWVNGELRGAYDSAEEAEEAMRAFVAEENQRKRR